MDIWNITYIYCIWPTNIPIGLMRKKTVFFYSTQLPLFFIDIDSYHGLHWISTFPPIWANGWDVCASLLKSGLAVKSVDCWVTSNKYLLYFVLFTLHLPLLPSHHPRGLIVCLCGVGHIHLRYGKLKMSPFCYRTPSHQDHTHNCTDKRLQNKRLHCWIHRSWELRWLLNRDDGMADSPGRSY